VASQVWTGDLGTEQALADRRDLTMWCQLDRLGPRETAELVLDSYGIRGGPGRRKAVAEGDYLPPPDGE
jgi:hypothetical protein